DRDLEDLYILGGKLLRIRDPVDIHDQITLADNECRRLETIVALAHQDLPEVFRNRHAAEDRVLTRPARRVRQIAVRGIRTVEDRPIDYHTLVAAFQQFVARVILQPGP